MTCSLRQGVDFYSRWFWWDEITLPPPVLTVRTVYTLFQLEKRSYTLPAFVKGDLICIFSRWKALPKGGVRVLFVSGALRLCKRSWLSFGDTKAPKRKSTPWLRYLLSVATRRSPSHITSTNLFSKFIEIGDTFRKLL